METNSEDFRTLVQASGLDDKDAYRKLYEHLVDRIFAYVRSRTTSKEQAIDLTQEVFVDLWKALPRFTYQSREQFYAYVFVIVKRKLAKLYASRGKETISLDEDFPLADPHTHNPEMTHDVQRALSVLDHETREILVLHHWSRYTFGEIAVLTTMTESAVRVRHHRALKLLRVELEKGI